MRLSRPRSVKTLVKIPIFAFGGAMVLMLGYIGAHELTAYTDSPAFCGGICHEAMSPEFTTHEVSPHSTVACSDCHVGAGALNMITSKLDSARDVLSTITRDYARPITTPIKASVPPAIPASGATGRRSSPATWSVPAPATIRTRRTPGASTPGCSRLGAGRQR